MKKKNNTEEIIKFFGVLKDKDIDWKSKEKRMKEFRRNFNERLGKN